MIITLLALVVFLYFFSDFLLVLLYFQRASLLHTPFLKFVNYFYEASPLKKDYF